MLKQANEKVWIRNTETGTLISVDEIRDTFQFDAAGHVAKMLNQPGAVIEVRYYDDDGAITGILIVSDIEQTLKVSGSSIEIFYKSHEFYEDLGPMMRRFA